MARQMQLKRARARERAQHTHTRTSRRYTTTLRTNVCTRYEENTRRIHGDAHTMHLRLRGGVLLRSSLASPVPSVLLSPPLPIDHMQLKRARISANACPIIISLSPSPPARRDFAQTHPSNFYYFYKMDQQSARVSKLACFYYFCRTRYADARCYFSATLFSYYFSLIPHFHQKAVV